jgi:hypothetical protein
MRLINAFLHDIKQKDIRYLAWTGSVFFSVSVSFAGCGGFGPAVKKDLNPHHCQTLIHQMNYVVHRKMGKEAENIKRYFLVCKPDGFLSHVPA